MYNQWMLKFMDVNKGLHGTDMCTYQLLSTKVVVEKESNRPISL